MPTIGSIQQRLNELLAFQASQQSGQTTQPLDEPEVEDVYPGYELEEPAEHHPGYDEEPEFPSTPALPTLAAPALHGLAGKVVHTLAPHTEADPAAILLQLLAAFGNLVGSAPHALVGATRHGLNLFVILVGDSSKARKGTSWRQIAGLFAEVDPGWTARCVTTARPTPATILQALNQEQSGTGHRRFLLSEEFASILHVTARQTGQLSPLLRSAWDGGDLFASDGHHLLHTATAHISLVGHVTQGELAQHLSHIDAHNGFANRCLWTSVRRSQSLPEGGSLPPEQRSALAGELRLAYEWTQSQTPLLFRRAEAARALWNQHYPALSQGRPDLYGAATSRAEAQVLRLSAIYAALDCSPLVEACHLQAALAVWDYCQASAALFFDASPVDPIARRITQAIDASPEGLSKTQIRRLFGGRISSMRIDLALEQLCSLGLTSNHIQSGRGRPATLWNNNSTSQPGT